jgi:hypothetical protein
MSVATLSRTRFVKALEVESNSLRDIDRLLVERGERAARESDPDNQTVAAYHRAMLRDRLAEIAKIIAAAEFATETVKETT